MNYSNLYEKLRLDELGISSDEEAEELEYELELSFEDFTPGDRRTWLRQSDYLEHYSRTGTVSSAAKNAGVSIFKAQRWQYDNVFGFTRRDEVATLIFKDGLKEKALARASDPKAPATLLIELLRAYIPEEFSRNGHKCDSSKSDELLRRYREDARRDMEADHPGLSKLAEDAEDEYHPDDWPIEPDVYDDDNYHTDMNDYPDEPVSPDDNPLLDESDDYQHDRPSPNRHSRAGTSSRTTIRDGNPENPSASSAVNPPGPAAVNPSPSPVVGESLPRTRYGGWGEGEPPSPQAPFSTSTQNPAPGTPIPNRAQRRAQLRQQRKAEKKNTFPVKRF